MLKTKPKTQKPKTKTFCGREQSTMEENSREQREVAWGQHERVYMTTQPPVSNSEGEGFPEGGAGKASGVGK